MAHCENSDGLRSTCDKVLYFTPQQLNKMLMATDIKAFFHAHGGQKNKSLFLFYA